MSEHEGDWALRWQACDMVGGGRQGGLGRRLPGEGRGKRERAKTPSLRLDGIAAGKGCSRDYGVGLTPLMAQNRSEFCSSLATRMSPLGVTTSISRTWSAARPYFGLTLEWPPPVM